MFTDFGTFVNTALYVISGLCFGCFASRYSVLATKKLLAVFKERRTFYLPGIFLQIVFLLTAFFIFPLWFSTRTQAGSFVYYAALIYFYRQGYFQYIKGKEE